MNSLLRRRTINEILTTRKQQRVKKAQITKSQLIEVPTQQKIEALFRKNSFNNEDKITLLRFIEKKYRIRFGVSFGLPLLSWVVEKEKGIIDKHYDSSKRSYFILRGSVTLCQRRGLRQTCRSQDQRFEESLQLAQGGIGCIFDPQASFQRCLLIANNAVLLQIDHQQGELQDLERNCLLTTQQNQSALKLFPLFSELANINKFYAPYFKTQQCSKGDIIYNIGDKPQYFYLVIEGEVSFESQIQVENPELAGSDPAIAELTLRNTFPKYLSVNTQIITACNFFGEEEIINETLRSQVARCSSLTCILILVPIEKFTKLMFYNEFRDCLTKAARNRQIERTKTIKSATNLNFFKQQATKGQRYERNHSSVHFTDLNKKIYFSRKKDTHKKTKICLPDRKVKLIHGNPVRLSTQYVGKPEKFSMLEVNRTQYESSVKKFRGYSLKEKQKYSMTSTIRKDQTSQDDGGQACARSLKQIWQVLKLEKVLQEDIDRLPIDNSEGKEFYNTYMRRTKHLDHVKSYRPKTISSSTRAKTDYLDYVQQML